VSALLLILLSAVLVHVIVLASVPAWRPFVDPVGVFEGAVAFAAMAAVALPATIVLTYLLSHWVLIPYGLEYLRALAFALTICAIAAALEPLLRKMTRLTPAQPAFALLTVANSAALGVALTADARARGLLDAVGLGIGTALVFGLTLLAFAALYERLHHADVPEPFRQAPLALVTIGIVALGFMGFSGLIRE
jgi:Na+-translocating ferredoxin:NAD+ oxidoreductase subunit A